MLRTLYSLGILLYYLGVRVFALFSEKAGYFVQGRKAIWKELDKIDDSKPLTWFHCASLGEFEQLRPLLEEMRKRSPEQYILLTFYSPSGYRVRSNYIGADLVTYLPIDLPWLASRFIRKVKPRQAIFVKYEFWFNFLHLLRKRKIPAFLVSGIFRPSQYFFHWYGVWPLSHLRSFRHLFVQDERSEQLLLQSGIQQVSITGDTRFDRVAELRNSPLPEGIQNRLVQDGPLLVAGSTWPADEAIILDLLSSMPGLRLIMAPHEIDEKNLRHIRDSFKEYGPLSNLSDQSPEAVRILVIDRIGLLSRIYRLADFAYIGGGFGKGIHNTLEAATWGVPVIFGPEHHKFREAGDLINEDAARCIQNSEELKAIIREWTDEPGKAKQAGIRAAGYIDRMAGATGRILETLLPMNKS